MFRLPAWTWPFLLLLALTFPAPSHQAGSALGERAFPALSAAQIAALVRSPDPVRSVDPANRDSHLAKMLIPRVVDTPNNTLVRQYITSTLAALHWHIEEDAFTAHTPLGSRRFTNVVATHDPTAPRRVVLAAHFDSKYFEGTMDQFVGATDSAAPCAMMLDLAEALTPLLARRQRLQEAGEEEDEDVADTTLQLVFFDGEEAFDVWTDTDSIYGARHLAQTWSTTYLPPPAPHHKRRLLPPSGLTSLDTIEHLILLDLLGAPQPHIRSFFPDTAWLFDALAGAERTLAESGAFAYSAKGAAKGTGAGADKAWESFFVPRTGAELSAGYIGDDHVPFLKRGVNVLHLIPEPFPRVWHTLHDDATALDIPTMRRWNLILRVFFAEYLHLRPDTKPAAVARGEEEGGEEARVVQKSNGELVDM